MITFCFFIASLMVLQAKAHSDYFYNGTSTFLQVSTAIEVGLYTVEETPKFLGLIKLPIANVSTITGASTPNSNKTGITNTLKITFDKNINSTANTTVTSVILNFAVNLVDTSGYWQLDEITIDYNARVAGKSYSAKGQKIVAAPVSGFTSSPLDLNCQRDYTTCAPKGLSWTCDRQVFQSENFGNKTTSVTEAGVTLNFPGLVYQPFFVGVNGSVRPQFGFNWDCDPLIASSLWTSLLIGLGLIYVMYWFLGMISMVFTPDRFSDPKKPQIQVAQNE